ncbi:MAG: hypothetical protein NZZ41_07740 [Candidatus Dojkabacteria bacterium]|nr:hypothetical protein [Candidatus Dojkabacteria bacterium]
MPRKKKIENQQEVLQEQVQKELEKKEAPKVKFALQVLEDGRIGLLHGKGVEKVTTAEIIMAALMYAVYESRKNYDKIVNSELVKNYTLEQLEKLYY